MKLYLSSYKFGDEPQKLVALFGSNKKVGLISNSLDFSTDKERVLKSQEEQLKGLRELGLEPEVIDLKEYFGKKEELRLRLHSLGGVWVRGGNVFVLRIAYQLSGLDELILEELHNDNDFVYACFSAGVCVLQNSLEGLDLVDDMTVVKPTYGMEINMKGVGILNYSIVPHYLSNHPESEMMNAVIELYDKKGIEYKTLKDGEVLILNSQTLLSDE